MDKILIISFGVSGIAIDILLIVLVIIFMAVELEMNSFAGYRTSFSMSNEETWKWCNKIFNRSTLIVTPLLLLIHIALFILSLIYSWNPIFIAISMFGFIYLIIPMAFYIEIVGRRKFKNIVK